MQIRLGLPLSLRVERSPMLPHFKPTELSALDATAKVTEKAKKVKTVTDIDMAGCARSVSRDYFTGKRWRTYY